ncbi:vegetative cell wall protein gp1-like [Homarus americanus]|uniref:vegetative cell wall protein gp1-like n=1 Tax=Homarus americanus TaxID=6706 RepID=UPI001C43CD9B|nr:vegetative cell wall protein gp1-like [Homarus americanus]
MPQGGTNFRPALLNGQLGPPSGPPSRPPAGPPQRSVAGQSDVQNQTLGSGPPLKPPAAASPVITTTSSMSNGHLRPSLPTNLPEPLSNWSSRQPSSIPTTPLLDRMEMQATPVSGLTPSGSSTSLNEGSHPPAFRSQASPRNSPRMSPRMSPITTPKTESGGHSLPVNGLPASVPVSSPVVSSEPPVSGTHVVPLEITQTLQNQLQVDLHSLVFVEEQVRIPSRIPWFLHLLPIPLHLLFLSLKLFLQFLHHLIWFNLHL